MTAFYLTSTSAQTLLSMLITMQGNVPALAYQNVIGPLPATPAIPAVYAADGVTVDAPAVPAAGVLGNYYMSINLPNDTVFPTALPSGVTEDDTNGIAVLGVWA